MFYKVSLVGDMGLDLFARIDADLAKNIEKMGVGEHWDVVSYRLSEDETYIEHFESIGSGFVISDDHIAVALNNKGQITQQNTRLTSTEPSLRRALMFLRKESGLAKRDFTSTRFSKDNFSREIEEELTNSGLVVMLEETGFKSLAVTCSCKGFWGSTSGCTSATCTVVLGYCQENPDCKRTDMISACACRPD
jgi:hypothetical protein